MIASPRTLLLTWCAPDSPYAGGEVLRRIVRRMPQDTVRWIGATPERDSDLRGIDWRSVPSSPLHWRLRGGELGHWWSAVRDVPRMAAAVEAEARAFKPEVLWVLGELSAVGVGLRLADRLGIPLHVTVHDAPEESRFSGVPPIYGVHYRKSVRRLLRKARSVDTVSQELFRHLRDLKWVGPACEGVTLPPSVPAAWMTTERGDVSHGAGGHPDGAVLRIGMCGSLRVGRVQWRKFLDMLSGLPFEIEIVLFGSVGDLGGDFPSRITVKPQPYADSEETVISTFRSGVDACYLGLWREHERDLFARTSLSSKLAAYAAAGCPIIVDAPEDSVAWRLVRDYGAGILLNGEHGAQDRQALTRFLGHAGDWRCLSEGAQRLCREEFNLDENVRRFAEALAKTARTGPAR